MKPFRDKLDAEKWWLYTNGGYPAFRTGMMVHANQIKALMPGKLVTGNIGDWGRPGATVPEYKDQLDGGLPGHPRRVGKDRSDCPHPTVLAVGLDDLVWYDVPLTDPELLLAAWQE